MMTERTDPVSVLPLATARALGAARARVPGLDPQASETLAFYALLGALETVLGAMADRDPANYGLCMEIARHSLESLADTPRDGAVRIAS